jgi:hypothetical protein
MDHRRWCRAFQGGLHGFKGRRRERLEVEFVFAGEVELVQLPAGPSAKFVDGAGAAEASLEALKVRQQIESKSPQQQHHAEPSAEEMAYKTRVNRAQQELCAAKEKRSVGLERHFDALENIVERCAKGEYVGSEEMPALRQAASDDHAGFFVQTCERFKRDPANVLPPNFSPEDEFLKHRHGWSADVKGKFQAAISLMLDVTRHPYGYLELQSARDVLDSREHFQKAMRKPGIDLLLKDASDILRRFILGQVVTERELTALEFADRNAEGYAAISSFTPTTSADPGSPKYPVSPG